MKFIRSESYGPYTVFMSGEDGKEVQTQVFLGDKVTFETTNATKRQAEKWVTEQLQERQ